jgi:hypothetical protein
MYFLHRVCVTKHNMYYFGASSSSANDLWANLTSPKDAHGQFYSSCSCLMVGHTEHCYFLLVSFKYNVGIDIPVIFLCTVTPSSSYFRNCLYVGEVTKAGTFSFPEAKFASETSSRFATLAPWASAQKDSEKAYKQVGIAVPSDHKRTTRSFDPRWLRIPSGTCRNVSPERNRGQKTTYGEDCLRAEVVGVTTELSCIVSP